MDLIELRQAVRRWAAKALIVAVAVAALGFVAVWPSSASFSSSTRLIAVPRIESFDSAAAGLLRVLLSNALEIARSGDLRASLAPGLGAAGQEEVTIDGTFNQDKGVMTIVADSPSSSAAVAWSNAVADALVERYGNDAYLDVTILDRADAARPRPAIALGVDLAAVLLLAAIAWVFAVFTFERVHESGNLANRVRTGGIPVFGELVLPAGAPRPRFTRDGPAAGLAMSLASAPGVEAHDRFVVLSTGVSPAVSVVDAIRAGLQQVGMQRQHKVALGPAVDDVPGVRAAMGDRARLIVVLDATQPIGEFLREVHALLDAGFPVIGAVIVRRQVVRRRVAERRSRDRRPRARGRSRAATTRHAARAR